MSAEIIKLIIRETERRVVEEGVPAREASVILIAAEDALIQEFNRSERKSRQLVLALRQEGTSEIARRHGKSPRTIRRWRHRALNNIGHFKAAA